MNELCKKDDKNSENQNNRSEAELTANENLENWDEK